MIDTHAHLDDPVYQEHFSEFIASQKLAGVEAVVVPGVSAISAKTVIDTCQAAPDFCFPALGVHPEEIKDDWQEQLMPIENELRKGNCVAVGEIGLDYHFDKTFQAQQKKALEYQLELALELNLPVLLHNRDSTEDMLQMLLPYSKRGLKGVMHCFSGSKETAKRVLDMGLYLGIGGVLTFKNSKLGETLNYVPLERIVLETDAPYLAPVPFRGKTNEPRYIQYVIEYLSHTYNTGIETIDRQTSSNAHQLLSLKTAYL